MSFDPEKVQRYECNDQCGWMEDVLTRQIDLDEGEDIYVHASDYDKLLSLLHDVSSEADPAGTLRELRQAQDTIRVLEAENEELKAEIQRLRND